MVAAYAASMTWPTGWRALVSIGMVVKSAVHVQGRWREEAVTGRARTPGRRGRDGGGTSGHASVVRAEKTTAESAQAGRLGAGDGRGSDGGPLVPEFADAEIDSKKITAYAMNPEHPVGGNKYRVINSATGMEAGDAARIEEQIRAGVLEGTPIMGRADQYGQRWAVDLPLTGPRGSIMVRTAWMLDAGSTRPRLVTVSFP